MNILVTGAWQQAADYITDIEKLGHKVTFLQYEKDELPIDSSFIEGVICNGLFQSHHIEKFPNLKYIQLTSAGFDRVPMDYVKEHNIEIHNAKGVYSIPMAEYAICGVLQLYKKSFSFLENQKIHKWEKVRNLVELYGKTVVIVGCGSVGNECAKRFKAFGCNVIGVDIYPVENENYSSVNPLDKLNIILENADIVILTVPLTNETKHLMNKERFSHMKNGSLLVNISRGAVVDTDALICALKDKLGGAVLDVFEEEPLDENSPLWDMENIIITPHNSFVGDGNGKRMSDLIMCNLFSKSNQIKIIKK